ncbi:MAG: GEVED domain-containing protein, partial [Leucothrix sp.]
AQLIAWIDFDGNGVFDPDEAAVRSIPTGTVGSTITLNWFSIPSDIQVGDTFVRLRLTTESINNQEPIAAKSDGEVEDYPLTIVSGGVTVSGRVYVDTNSNATEDSGEAGIGSTVVVLHDIFTGTCFSIKTMGNGDYSFTGVPDGGYELYQAHGEATPVPQNCGTSFANNPTGYQSTTADILYVTVAGADITDQDFGEVAGANSPATGNTGAGIRFEPDNQSEILPGNITFYPHTFSSDAEGAVSFTSSGSGGSVNGWTQTIYQDTDCNGTLNGTEGDTPINGVNFGIPAGGRLCLIDKVYAPANVPAQDRYEVTTTATFTYAGGSLPPAVLAVTDITTAGQTVATPSTPQTGESRLELTKTVENTSQGTPETETLNQARPGDFLTYRIYYRNTGTGPINDLNVNDIVPHYAGLVGGSNACNITLTGMTCTPNLNIDELDWAFTGPLISGAEGHVSYEVMVDN